MEKFLVSYNDDQVVMESYDLQDFVSGQLLNSHNVNNVTINRIEAVDVDIDEYGQTSYVYDLKEYPSNYISPKEVNGLLSAIAMYALDTNASNVLRALDHLKHLSECIDNIEVQNHFNALALKVINSKI